MSRGNFFARVALRCEGLRVPLCLGVDPAFADADCPFFAKARSRDAEDFLFTFGSRAIGAALPSIGAVKFQSAFFEAWGPAGISALARLLKQCSDQNLPTILDAKRGDISSTMRGYGEAAFEVLQADALTVTPYLGVDVLMPLLPWLAADRAVYVVWTTSNPGADLLQTLPSPNGSGENTLRGFIFQNFLEFAERTGVEANLGWVLGATKVEGLTPELWARVAQVPLLLPGMGPQGGTVGPRLGEILRFPRRTHLIPMSRGLTGLGDASQSKAVRDLGSWDDFETLISRNCKKIQELSLRS